MIRDMTVSAVRRSESCCLIDVKPQLYSLDLTEEDPVFDAAIAAYLLNPLKDSYTYDGIAQDFLGDSAIQSRLAEETVSGGSV